MLSSETVADTIATSPSYIGLFFHPFPNSVNITLDEIWLHALQSGENSRQDGWNLQGWLSDDPRLQLVLNVPPICCGCREKHDNRLCECSVCIFEIIRFPGLHADEKLMLNQNKDIERFAVKWLVISGHTDCRFDMTFRDSIAIALSGIFLPYRSDTFNLYILLI